MLRGPNAKSSYDVVVEIADGKCGHRIPPAADAVNDSVS
jgi:hypothetical protein